MVGAPLSHNSSMANQTKYAPPQFPGQQAYATPNATLSTVLPYGGSSAPSAYPSLPSYSAAPSGYPQTSVPPPATAQPYNPAAAYPPHPTSAVNNFPIPCPPGSLGQTYPPTNNYGYPPSPAPPSNCFNQLTPTSYPPSYPPSVYPAGPQPHGTYPPTGGAGVYPPPPSSGHVYPPPYY